MSNGNPNIKSNIFELYSQARALTQMRVAATRCSTSIRTVYALLETVSQNKREVSQQEIERGFTTLGECLQSAEPMSSDSSCSSARRAMVSACGRDLDALNDELEKEMSSPGGDIKRKQDQLVKMVNSLPHDGTAAHTRCTESMEGFFTCLNPNDSDPNLQADFQKLAAINMFIFEQMQQSQGY